MARMQYDISCTTHHARHGMICNMTRHDTTTMSYDMTRNAVHSRSCTTRHATVCTTGNARHDTARHVMHDATRHARHNDDEAGSKVPAPKQALLLRSTMPSGSPCALTGPPAGREMKGRGRRATVTASDRRRRHGHGDDIVFTIVELLAITVIVVVVIPSSSSTSSVLS